ncbi:DMT family transporter [Peptoanaerobacter stomatis]
MLGEIIIKSLGFFEAVLSAVMFGAMPLFTKILYSYGSDAVSSGFYRMLLSLPFIFICSKFIFKYDMSINKSEFKPLFIVSLGFSFTVITLFNSYNYINSGAATSIHFTYPIIIFIATSIISKEKPLTTEILCIIGASIGLMLITDFNALSNFKGVFYAFLSAFTYSFYSIYLEKSDVIKKMPPFKALFYINAIGAVILFFYAHIAFIGIYRNFSINIWLIVFAYSFILTVGATFLYQRAVSKIGAKYTSILSTLEVVTSIIIGFFILNEKLTATQTVAVSLIFLSSLVLVKSRK